MSFKPVTSQVNFPKQEEDTLKFWQENKIFEKSVRQRLGQKPFVFYEGPPTANGKPGIHHVMARSFKDLYPRYHTMRGEYCERKGGWDTHGLPVELEVEKKLKLSGKQQIEEYGIAAFNQKCRESVWEYVDEWINLTQRIGYWVDLENAYVTLDNKYIETGWWILKQLWDQQLLVKDYKVLPYCPRCGTPISSHELALGYQDDTETSVYVKFKLADSDAFLLAWTTTPWTLPGNVALAIDPKSTYVKVDRSGDKLILAKNRLGILSGDYNVLEEFPGKKLLNKKYVPLFEFIKYDKPTHFIVPAGFVSMEEGTGIVHTAVMYGVEDFNLGKKVGLPNKHLVNTEGKFIPEVAPWAGMFVKDADPEIISDLRDRKLLYKEEIVTHSYPHCWRCKTPLLYYAIESWFIKTTAKKKEIIAQNTKINWIPSHIKKGRMGEWLANMVDWSLSRSRYWGTPLPIWKCDNCASETCIGSIKELGLDHDIDLHRPFIDDVKLKCSACGGRMSRYPFVLDCWFDSGAMPYAQQHYPFENQEKFASQFPADFIAEGQDQTRGWFYTLLTLGTLVSGRSSFKNVVCHNLVLDETGKKMSKSVGNVVNPWEMIDKYGADVVRWYFYSYAPMGNEYRFNQKDLTDTARRFHLMLWNIYSFFVTYANIDKFDPKLSTSHLVLSTLDKWILARLNQTISAVTKSLDKYDAYTASHSIEDFVNDLSLWYVRRSRDRVGPSAIEQNDKIICLSTLHFILSTLSRLLPPFPPYLSEEIYRNLTGDESVHLSDWPKSGKINNELTAQMIVVRKIVELGLSSRKTAGIKVRQPLRSITIHGQDFPADLQQLIKDELNVKNVIFEKSGELSVELDLKLDDALIAEGRTRELIRQIQDKRKELGARLDQKINLVFPSARDNREPVGGSVCPLLPPSHRRQKQRL